MTWLPHLERVCAKFEHFASFWTQFSLTFDGNDRQPPLPKQSKQSKIQYHTNTTFLTTFPKRIKKAVNTTQIPVKFNHCSPRHRPRQLRLARRLVRAVRALQPSSGSRWPSEPRGAARHSPELCGRRMTPAACRRQQAGGCGCCRRIGAGLSAVVAAGDALGHLRRAAELYNKK